MALSSSLEKQHLVQHLYSLVPLWKMPLLALLLRFMAHCSQQLKETGLYKWCVVPECRRLWNVIDVRSCRL